METQASRLTTAHAWQNGFWQTNESLSIDGSQAKAATLRPPREYSDCSIRADVTCESSVRITRKTRTFNPMADFSRMGITQQLDEAFQSAEISQMQCVPISQDIVLCLLQDCTEKKDLEVGKRVHSLIVKDGLQSVSVLQEYLIRLFAACGSLQEADILFCKIAKPSLHTWHVIIHAHAEHGGIERALHLYSKMRNMGLKPNKPLLLCILKTCGSQRAKMYCKMLHEDIIRSGLQLDESIGSSLLKMHAKCGTLKEARKVFDELLGKTTVSWNAMIRSYVEYGHSHIALELFEKMLQEGIKPNKITFLSILKACGNIGALWHGDLIRDMVMQSELASDVFIGSALIDMYAKSGRLEEAQNVLDELSNQNVVLWNTMIAGYVRHGCGSLALELFENMQGKGVKPNAVTFSCVLKACGSIGAIWQGKMIHKQVMRCELNSNVFIGSALVGMYAKCGNLEEARRAFDELPDRDVVSWSAMIAGYAQHGHGLPALELFGRMQAEGIVPNKVTFSCVLNACGSIGALGYGRLIHEWIVSSVLELDVFIGSTLVDMYAKCGSLREAHKVFDELRYKNVVLWNSMIAGYVDCGDCLPALELFEKMYQEEIYPNKVTFSCILEACGTLGARGQGQLIHSQIIKSGFDLDAIVGNTLIGMYAKFGSMEEACTIFEKLPKPDLVSWGELIAGYARHGNCRMARQCLTEMQRQGFKPDGVIFTSILMACSHAGEVEKGQGHFKSMRQEYGISPHIEHFGCMVDLLARAGHLNEAEDLLDSMPLTPDVRGWLSLLSACKTYGIVALGRRCFDQVFQLYPNTAAGYVLMSNIYADAHRWEDAHMIQELRRNSATWKKPGRAWIEVGLKVHEFTVGDKTHPQRDEIHACLKRLMRVMEDEGYKPQLSLVLDPMSNHDKENALSQHSEKLAIAFGLLNTPVGTTIRVTKNLRVCADCHSAARLISKIEGRRIVINDAYCIHQFEDGVCSCGDYF